jgi:hypothetical protein
MDSTHRRYAGLLLILDDSTPLEAAQRDLAIHSVGLRPRRIIASATHVTQSE